MLARGTSRCAGTVGKSQCSICRASFCSFSACSISAKRPQVRVRLQFRRQEPIGPQKENRRFLEAFFPLRPHQPRPPVRRGKIFARKLQLLEIILEQQPRPLRIDALGENVEQFGALGDRGLGVGQLAPQIRLRPISPRKHGMMRIIFGRASRTWPNFSATLHRRFFGSNTGP